MVKWTGCSEEARNFVHAYGYNVFTQDEIERDEFTLEHARATLTDESTDVRKVFIHHSNIMEDCLNIISNLKHSGELQRTRFYRYKRGEWIRDRSSGIIQLATYQSNIDHNFKIMDEAYTKRATPRMHAFYQESIPILLYYLEVVINRLQDTSNSHLYAKANNVAPVPSFTPTKVLPFNKDSMFMESDAVCPGAPKKPAATSRIDPSAISCARNLVPAFDAVSQGPDLTKYLPVPTVSNHWNPLL
jgi:hypothetical protein